MARQQDAERRERDRLRKREVLEARITALRREFELEEQEADAFDTQNATREEMLAENREVMARSRQTDAAGDGLPAKKRRGTK